MTRTKRPTLHRDQLDLGPPTQVALQESAYKPCTTGANPALEQFVGVHSTPYDPASQKPTIAFDRDLLVHKHNKLYSMHAYWSKKDPLAIAEYIRHYTKENALVLDPFCGSGTTGCAARLSNRHVILSDASPAAAFLASHYCLFAGPLDAEASLHHLLSDGRGTRVDELFRTTCHKCGGPGVIEYVIWSDTYQCPRCAQIVPLFSCPEVNVQVVTGTRATGRTEIKKRRVCPSCLRENEGRPHADFAISTRSPRYKPVPVASKYLCLKKCTKRGVYRSVNDDDASARTHLEYDLQKAKSNLLTADVSPEFSAPFPKQYRYKRDALEKFGIETLGDLFTPRNRAALSILLSAPRRIDLQIDPRLYVTWILHKCSLMMGCGADGVGRINMGTYYIPPIRMEARPTKYLAQAKSQIRGHFAEKARHHAKTDYLISNESALRSLPRLPPDSIDYVFTDPAYNYKVQYGELNYPWEAVLGFDLKWIDEEIVENPCRNKTFDDWSSDLRKCVSGIFRVLKPSCWLSLCYHDTDPHTWTVVQDILLDCGFEMESVTALEPVSKSRNAITAEIVVKSDLVLNCRKPEYTKDREPSTTREAGIVGKRVSEILVETLTKANGQARDRLWDAVLKRLLSRGQMAEHRFDEILADIAMRSESGRWFLKEEFEKLSDSEIRNEEAAGSALERFARLRCAGVAAPIAADVALHHPNLAAARVNDFETLRHGV